MSNLASTVSRRLRWLGFVRVVFGLTFLLGFPRATNLGVESLPSSLFFPPLGPFALLTSYPSAAFIMAIEILLLVFTVTLTAGVFTFFSSWMFAILFTIAGGIQYSTGKIDHDFIIPLAAAVLSSVWGGSLALRPSRTTPNEQSLLARVQILSLAVGAFWISSGLIKAFTGWIQFHPSNNPILEWFTFYTKNYGLTPLPGLEFIYDPTLSQLISVLTVALEIVIGAGFLIQRFRIAAFLLAILTHLAIAAVFQILFFKLIPLYLAMLPPPKTFPWPRLNNANPAGIGFAFLFCMLAANALLSIIQRSVALPWSLVLVFVAIAYLLLNKNKKPGGGHTKQPQSSNQRFNFGLAFDPHVHHLNLRYRTLSSHSGTNFSRWFRGKQMFSSK